jgi:hypothetical protein
MEELITISEIKNLYPDEWVLLGNPPFKVLTFKDSIKKETSSSSYFQIYRLL